MGDAGGIVAAVLAVIIVLICAGIVAYVLWKRRRYGSGEMCCGLCGEKERVVSTPRAKTTNRTVTTGLVAVTNKCPQPVQNLTMHNEVDMELYSVSTNMEPPAYSETMQESLRRFTPQCKVRHQNRRESLCSKASETSKISNNSRQTEPNDTSNVRRVNDHRGNKTKTNRSNQKGHRANRLPSHRLPSYKSKTMPKHFFQTAKSQAQSTQLTRRHSDLTMALSTKSRNVTCNRRNSTASHLGLETSSKLLKQKQALRKNKANSNALRHISTQEDLNFVGIDNEAYDDEDAGGTSSRSHLTRSGTILELPIYCQQKNKHRTSSRTKNRIPPAGTKYENGINVKSGERRKRRKRRHTRKTLDKPSKHWTSGYGSLPADLSKIPKEVVENFGMDPIESLNFEKLCRPLPDLSKNSTLSPRKSVLEKIGSHVNNKEREILANTYEYEDLGLVSTDL